MCVTAPPEKCMGYAGKIISGGLGSTDSKCAVLAEAGVQIVKSPSELGERMLEFFEG